MANPYLKFKAGSSGIATKENPYLKFVSEESEDEGPGLLDKYILPAVETAKNAVRPAVKYVQQIPKTIKPAFKLSPTGQAVEYLKGLTPAEYAKKLPSQKEIEAPYVKGPNAMFDVAPTFSREEFEAKPTWEQALHIASNETGKLAMVAGLAYAGKEALTELPKMFKYYNLKPVSVTKTLTPAQVENIRNASIGTEPVLPEIAGLSGAERAAALKTGKISQTYYEPGKFQDDFVKLFGKNPTTHEIITKLSESKTPAAKPIGTFPAPKPDTLPDYAPRESSPIPEDIVKDLTKRKQALEGLRNANPGDQRIVQAIDTLGKKIRQITPIIPTETPASKPTLGDLVAETPAPKPALDPDMIEIYPGVFRKLLNKNEPVLPKIVPPAAKKLSPLEMSKQKIAEATKDLSKTSISKLENGIREINQQINEGVGGGRRMPVLDQEGNNTDQWMGVKSLRPKDLINQKLTKAKKYELARTRLENGYTTADGVQIPPDVDFLAEIGQADKAREIDKAFPILDPGEYEFYKQVIDLHKTEKGTIADASDILMAKDAIERYEARRKTLYEKEVQGIDQKVPAKKESIFGSPASQEQSVKGSIPQTSLLGPNPILEPTKPVENGLAYRSVKITNQDPDIALPKDMTARDTRGNKITIPADTYTPHKLNTGNVILQDGQQFTIPKNQYLNIKNQSKPVKAGEFAPELKQVEETVKGTPTPFVNIEAGQKVKSGDASFTVVDPIEQNELGQLKVINESGQIRHLRPDQINGQPVVNTKFSQYTLPGGENYREVLIKAPQTVKSNSIMQAMKDLGLWKEESGFGQYDKLSAKNKALVDIQKNKTLQENIGKTEFKSSHWDEPNVLSHLRMNDRVTPNGKKVLFLEELQSDWAKEGRTKGFSEEFIKPDLQIEKAGNVYNVVDRATNTILASTNSSISATERLNQLKLTTKEQVRKGVPPHPLLKSWQSLSLKRALKEAVDGDYDYLAWINGKQTSARYNLATYVKSVDWQPSSVNVEKLVAEKSVSLRTQKGETLNLWVDDSGTIKATSDVPTDWAGKKLDEVLGKGLADKIMEKESGTLSGEGLKFGGEWADNLYDRQVPNILKDLTGAKAETIKIGAMESKENVYYKYEPKKILTTQQAIHITPEIRAMVKGEALAKQPSGKLPVMAEAKPSLSPLHQEALKYKTPKEFVKSKIVSGEGHQLVTLYHGTTKEGMAGIGETGYIEGHSYYGTPKGKKYVSLSPDKATAHDYGDGKEIIKVEIPKGSLRVDNESVDYDDIGRALEEGKNVFAVDNVYIKTRSQLTAIWNEAHSGGKPSSLALGIVPFSAQPINKYLKFKAPKFDEIARQTTPTKIEGDLKQILEDSKVKETSDLGVEVERQTITVPKQNRIMPDEFAANLLKLNDLTNWEKSAISLLHPWEAAKRQDGAMHGLVKQYILQPMQTGEKNLFKDLKEFKTEFDKIKKESGIHEGSNASALAQRIAEGNASPEEVKLATPKMQKMITWTRNKYDWFIDTINKERHAIGKDPVIKRKDYITHFNELNLIQKILDDFGSIFGEADIHNVPASMLQISEFTKPNSPYFKFAKKRMEGAFKEDIVGSMARYAEPAYKQIHLTKPTKQIRDLLEFRIKIPTEYEGHRQTGTSLFGMYYPNAYKYWTDWLNYSVGKRTKIDREMPTNLAAGLAVARNMGYLGALAGNVSSVLVQPWAIKNATAELGVYELKGAMANFNPVFRRIAANNSRVLMSRQFEVLPEGGKLKAVFDIGMKPLQLFDYETAQTSWLGAYFKGHDLGLRDKELFDYADDIALITNMSAQRIDRPPMNRSQVATSILQFMTFVYGEWAQMKDIVRGVIKPSNPKYVTRLNTILKQNRFDNLKRLSQLIVGFIILKKIYDEMGLPVPGDDVNFLGLDNPLLNMVSSSVPFVSSARYGGAPAYKLAKQAVIAAYSQDKQRKREMAKLPALAGRFLPYGGQAIKSYQGLEAVDRGYAGKAPGGRKIWLKDNADILRAIALGPKKTMAWKEYQERKKVLR